MTNTSPTPNPIANGVDEIVAAYVLEQHDVLIGAATAAAIYAFGPATRPGAAIVEKTASHVTIRGLDPATSAARDAVIDRDHLHRHIDRLVTALPLDDDSRRILDAARTTAGNLSQPYIGTEHFIAAFEQHRESAAGRLIAALGCDLTVARDRLGDFLTPRPDVEAAIFPGWTARSVRAINLAVGEMERRGQTALTSDLLAVGVVSDGEGLGAQALAALGVSLNAARAAIST